MDPLVNEESKAKPRRKVILIVEQDFLTRWGAAEFLRETGFEVIEAVSAKEALAAFRAESAIDAIFCDVDTISCAGGEEFYGWLEKHPNLPVLLAQETVHQGGTLVPLSTRANVAKPYAMSEVERRLHKLIAAR